MELKMPLRFERHERSYIDGVPNRVRFFGINPQDDRVAVLIEADALEEMQPRNNPESPEDYELIFDNYREAIFALASDLYDRVPLTEGFLYIGSDRSAAITDNI
jgi:hypothetical protein